ncbi:serine hydrolase [Gilvimarinus sp. SDUM040013]|uniref:Serine hydrolase n=1 Tax=Gilvimarinus gilvus TaxID=3058038 RepID=A0ABU4S2Y2_9GAMM|nr:serine hydrolase [Gilvimarinus sp. SDUM040013]MDO3384935.1 serine hydrolase [Gilvimarinus sp. SDUM040013]MDX6851532.1 serine hydrolase [Gilvimarinus sp. SDUM040013]
MHIYHRIGAVLLSLAACQASATPAEDIEQYLTHSISEQGLGVGAAVVVIEAGNTSVITLGLANAKTQEKLTRQHALEIGSISKTFTSLLLADSVQGKVVKLNDQVAGYMPEQVANEANGLTKVTFADLATHRSGLPRIPTDFSPLNFLDPYADYDREHLWKFLSGFDKTREPGTLVEYSNLGTGLLGELVAQANRSEYDKLLEQKILTPLKMQHSFINEPADNNQKVASPHFTANSPAPRWHFLAMAGAGAINASINDMHRYLALNLAPSGELADAISLTHKPIADVAPGLKIGLAWFIQSTPNATYHWHNGGTGGSRSFMAFDKENQRGIVILLNAAQDFDALGHAFMARTLGQYLADQTAQHAVAPDQLRKLTGEYQLAPGFVLSVTLEDDQLFAQATGQGKLPVFARSDTEFFFKAVEASLHFELDDTGVAQALTLQQNGQVMPASKLSL